jgi:hypothetical protein
VIFPGGRRSDGEGRRLLRGEVVAQPYALDRVAIAACVDGGVGDELGDQVRLDGAVCQLAAGSPSGAEVPSEQCGLPELGGAGGGGGLAPPQPNRRQYRPGRVLPVVLVPAVFEDEEWFGAMSGCFGERDGFSEAFEWERLAFGDAQHFISDETANLG